VTVQVVTTGVAEGVGLTMVADPVDRGVVRILDLEFVTKSPDGGIGVVDVAGLDTDPGVDLSAFAGASSGILDPSDIDEVGAAIGAGSVAAVLVYEELVIFPVVAAWRRGGARVIAEGQISPEDIVLALDAAESS